MIISTGMSIKDEVDRCLDIFGDQVQYILSCKSTYPTKDSDINLRFISTLKREYPKYRIGFSNHSAGIQFCLSAVALGAEMIEFHITLDRAMYGSDQAASIETPGVMKIGSVVRAIESAMGDGSWSFASGEEEIRKKLRG